jgi:hypothetical protein
VTACRSRAVGGQQFPRQPARLRRRRERDDEEDQQHLAGRPKPVAGIVVVGTVSPVFTTMTSVVSRLPHDEEPIEQTPMRRLLGAKQPRTLSSPGGPMPGSGHRYSP